MSKAAEVNLEQGMPYVADAVKRLTFEVHHSKSMAVPSSKSSTATAPPARAAKSALPPGSGWTSCKRRMKSAAISPGRSSPSLMPPPSKPFRPARNCARTGTWNAATTASPSFCCKVIPPGQGFRPCEAQSLVQRQRPADWPTRPAIPPSPLSSGAAPSAPNDTPDRGIPAPRQCLQAAVSPLGQACNLSHPPRPGPPVPPAECAPLPVAYRWRHWEFGQTDGCRSSGMSPAVTVIQRRQLHRLCQRRQIRPAAGPSLHGMDKGQVAQILLAHHIDAFRTGPSGRSPGIQPETVAAARRSATSHRPAAGGESPAESTWPHRFPL